MIDAQSSPLLRLTVFAALAAFAAAHWAALVTDPPVARAMLCVLALTAGAATLVLAGRAPYGTLRRTLLAALAALATLAVALLVIGMPVRLLAPPNWGELGSAIQTGLEGIEDVDYPYAGEHPWSRLVILLVLPVSLAAAVVLAFWPAHNRAPLLRALALAIVVGVYAIAVITDTASRPLLRGLVLFGLVAAWLWLPGLARRHTLAFGLLVAAAAATAVPLASALNADRPWLDYRHWTINVSGGGGSESFHWNHRYGPLDWPRTGKRLLEVRSESAHYWRAAVLDSFDGFSWRSSADAATGRLELPSQVAGGAAAWKDLDQRWIESVHFNVDSLSSQTVLTPGAVQDAEGDATLAATGVLVAEGPLEEGDAYEVRAYTPDPDSGQLRGAPDRFPPILSRFTTIRLPPRANPDGTRQPSEVVTVPLGGDPRRSSAVARQLSASAYAPVYALARRWSSAAPTTYDAVEAIERGLQENYEYSEDPPQRRYPLRAFLLADRGGYCQHYSGAMALMLRMIGIPSRVAAGFSAGERNGDRFVVRDTDSHSWVEVYFNGIGWVPFDPTPASAPAQSQATGPPLPPAPAGRPALPGLGSPEPGSGAPQGPRSDSSGGFPLWLAAAIGLALLAAGVPFLRRRRRFGSAAAGELAEAQLKELEAAMRRLGRPIAPGTTLRSLEKRLGNRRRPALAAYTAKLRAVRYGPGGHGPPTPGERRRLRRELSSGRGLGPRLRGLFAFPPGGPAPPVR